MTKNKPMELKLGDKAPNFGECRMHIELAGIAIGHGETALIQKVTADHLEAALAALRPAKAVDDMPKEAVFLTGGRSEPSRIWLLRRNGPDSFNLYHWDQVAWSYYDNHSLAGARKMLDEQAMYYEIRVK